MIPYEVLNKMDPEKKKVVQEFLLHATEEKKKEVMEKVSMDVLNSGLIPVDLILETTYKVVINQREGNSNVN